MELVDRYLHAIRPWLPLGAPRDEILRELSEDIRSQVDEQRGERGELTESEMVAILKARGHPMAVAAQYGRGDALIGRGLFPIFRLVVTIASYGLLPALAVMSIARTIASPHPLAAAVAALLESVQMVFMTLGVIVAVFVVLERYGKPSDLAVEWDPRRLPRARNEGPRLRLHALGVVAGNAVLAIAYASFASSLPLLLPGIHDAMLAGAFPGPELKAIFDATWQLVVALALVNVAAGAAMALRRELARTCTIVVASANAILGTVMIASVLPHWASAMQVKGLVEGARAVKAAGPSVDAAQLGQLLGPALDSLSLIILLAWGIGCLLEALVEAWRSAKL